MFGSLKTFVLLLLLLFVSNTGLFFSCVGWSEDAKGFWTFVGRVLVVFLLCLCRMPVEREGGVEEVCKREEGLKMMKESRAKNQEKQKQKQKENRVQGDWMGLPI